jgi:hypothetical protein
MMNEKWNLRAKAKGKSKSGESECCRGWRMRMWNIDLKNEEWVYVPDIG